jgi:Zn-dependent protease with chaperone function/uncharacterized tellurite resistance protein B-like protein
MNFFEAQEAARARTRNLVVLFGAALLAITVAVYATVKLALYTGGMPLAPLFDPLLFLAVALGVGLLVSGGSLARTLQLRQGGSRVALLLGGRRIASNTSDPAERRLLNIVEEMALASGTPVPAVFVLDDELAINAFAAGFTIHDAAVAVTRGTLEQLNRDELQGVVAHEFSHILNGDMRLNIRLIGLLYGILLLTVVGRGLLRGGAYGSRRRGKSGGQVALVGVGFVIIGSIGLFFGRLIKAAVSRQREFLADAAAVQFTRNPEGIGNALKKIGGAAALGGSRIRDHHAEELSHLFFADGLGQSLVALFATHPPLAERIRRVQPSWNGSYIPLKATEAAGERTARAPARTAPPLGSPAWIAEPQTVSQVPAGPRPGPVAPPVPIVAAGDDAAALHLVPSEILSSIGVPAAAHVEHARKLIDSLPEQLLAAARDPIGARAVLLALLVAADEATARRQWEIIGEYADGELLRPAQRLAPVVASLPAQSRLPLVDLALPVLRQFSLANAQAFQTVVDRVARADGRMSMFDLALIQVLARQLGPTERERDAPPPPPTLHSLSDAADAVERLLSAIALSGAADTDAARAAFTAASARLPDDRPWRLRSSAELGGAASLSGSLAALAAGSLAVRRQFLDACAHAVAHDGRVRPQEAELFRAIAESLDIPAPPWLAD